MRAWWLSFADPELPEGTQFLGVIISEGETFLEACLALPPSLNPGGEVQGFSVPPEHEDDLPHFRLLTRAEIEGMGTDTITTGDLAGEPEGDE